MFTPYSIYSSWTHLKLRKNSLNRRNLNILKLSLVLSIADRTILLNNHSPATSAVTLVRASLPAIVLREESLAIGEHEEVVALGDVVDLAPSIEHELVVVGDEGDNVDALGLELLELLDVGREVVGGAAGGESAWWWVLVSCFRIIASPCARVCNDHSVPARIKSNVSTIEIHSCWPDDEP
jgi:hypothetical protein